MLMALVVGRAVVPVEAQSLSRESSFLASLLKNFQAHRKHHVIFPRVLQHAFLKHVDICLTSCDAVISKPIWCLILASPYKLFLIVSKIFLIVLLEAENKFTCCFLQRNDFKINFCFKMMDFITFHLFPL